MNEFELIARLTRDLPTNASVVAGPGDDCALLDLGIPDCWLVFKTDAVVEGVHFTPDADPERIGHKALGRVLSDFAAAAARPVAAVITLGVPAPPDPVRLEGLYGGLKALAARWGVAIVGGETGRSTGGLTVGVAAVGTVARERAVRRSGARAGDAIFVSGELGGSLAGHHLNFEPRLAEAAWLAEHFRVRAMIDVSDGLAGDLRHILRASGVGAELLARSVPIHRAAKVRSRSGNGAKPPLLAALTDGEDFELLFAVAPGDAVRVLDGWKERFPKVRLTCVGRVTSEGGLRLRDAQGVHELPEYGYLHFG
ncbi:MAG: thiamine-monophosphate kinase [Verrucomicrobiae bacterium]|nr:thiamine-monophosphate kinase [Verrucomicrobiae bacterium]